MKPNPVHTLAQKLIRASLRAVDPYKLVQTGIPLRGNHLFINGRKIDLSSFKNIYVLGIGKAAAPMAAAFEDRLGNRLTQGAVIVKYGHGSALKKVKLFEAAHPVPDQNTLDATKQLLKIAATATHRDLVLFLISGGGSALFERLPVSIGLQDLKTFNEQLLGCGASIEEMNVLRKHISLVKGGRFAGITMPARLETFILSDVIGDLPENIASGPAAPDGSTFADAWRIITAYGLDRTFPATILNFFKRGLNGKEPETPKPGDILFKNLQNTILGNNRLALDTLQNTAAQAGYQTRIVNDRQQGEVHEVGAFWAEQIKKELRNRKTDSRKICLITGGEPTVSLKGNGLGGRNQELALIVLKLLKDIPEPFYFCSVGTDGTDGPTDAAGAWIDQDSYRIAVKTGLDIDDYLERNDSYHFFEQTGNLIKTGPTGTNVMDMMFCLL